MKTRKPVSRILALVLSAALLLSGTAAADGADCIHVHDEACGYKEGTECGHIHDESCGGLKTESAISVAAFDALQDEILWQGYGYGTVASLDALNLPDTLTGTGEDGNSVTITGVTWQSAPAFDPAVSAWYYFSPILPAEYILAQGGAAPVISVFIQPEGGEIPKVKSAGDTFTGSDGKFTYTVITEPEDGNPGTVSVGVTSILPSGPLTLEGSVSNDGKDYTVTAIASYAFYGSNTRITGSLIIPDSVTSIGALAFYGCTKLTGDLTIPDSVTAIGSSAFSGCTGFNGSLSLPAALTAIEGNVFYGCTGLTGSLTLPAVLTTIGNDAFSGCAGLTGGLTLPATLTTIGNSAFSGCTGLTGGLSIPSGVTAIGSSAFSGCTGLNGTLTIMPDAAIAIGTYAFAYCAALTAISSGIAGFENISTYAFSGLKDKPVTCDPALASIHREYGFTRVNEWGGFTIGVLAYTVITEPEGEKPGTVSVRATDRSTIAGPLSLSASVSDEGKTYTVTAIEDNAFRSCELTGALIIPNSVTAIGDSAFAYCTLLTSVSLPAGLATIGVASFAYCTGLTGSLTIPDSVTTISDAAFLGCNRLTSVTLPAGLETIGHFTFSACAGLDGNLKIPDSVTAIGEFAFENCAGLTSVTLPTGLTTIGDNAFYGCAGLTSVTLPTGLTTIGDYAFSGCEKLTSITLPAGLTTIGDCAFSGCEKLTSITSHITDFTNIHADAFWRKLSTPVSCPSRLIAIHEAYGFTNVSGFDAPAPAAPSFGSIMVTSFKITTTYNDTAKYGDWEYRIMPSGGDWGDWKAYDADTGVTGLSASTTYSVQVRYVGNFSYEPSAASTAAEVTTLTNALGGTAAITGTPAVGSELEVDLTSLTPAADDGRPVLQFQWQYSTDGSTGWINISAASGDMYRVPLEYSNKHLRVVINAFGKPADRVIASSVQIEKADLQGGVNIIIGNEGGGAAGVAEAGDVLRVDLSGILPASAKTGNFTYQWSGGSGSPANGATYTVTQNDETNRADITVTVTADTANDCTGSLTSAPVTAGRDPVTIDGLSIADSTYDPGSAHPGYTGTPRIIGGSPANTTLTVLYTGTANDNTTYSESTPPTKAGSYTVTVTLAEDSLYYGEWSASFTIHKAVPAYSAPTGLAAYGDTLADVSLTSGFTWDDLTTSVGDVGSRAFPATYTPPDTNNYNMASVNITVTVSPKDISITGVQAADRAYNGLKTVVLSGGVLQGVETGDTADIDVTLGMGTMQNKDVGSNKSVTTGITLSGTASGNYTLTQPANVTVNISAKNLTITDVTATDREYDGTQMVSITGGTLVGVITGDSVSQVVPAAGTISDANVGSGKAVTITSIMLTGADAGNYTLTQPSGIAVNIREKPISGVVTISINHSGGSDASKIDAGDTLTANISGITSGATVDYQWYRNDTAIPGAASPTYTVQNVAADPIGTRITVEVTGTLNFAGSVISDPVEVGKISLGGSISIIAGGTALGDTLTLDVTSLTPAGGNYNIQWLRDGAVITGQTTADYTITKSDQGKTITAAITGTGDYSGAMSAGINIPAAAPDAPQGLTAAPGNGQVTLSWSAPSHDGGSTITRYEVSGDGGSTWKDAGLNTSYLFTGLANGAGYTFEVRAVNIVGSGAVARAAATPVSPVTGVSLNQSSLLLPVGGSKTLTAAVMPDHATNKGVTWKSSDAAIATVDSAGRVTGVKAGMATITATTADGGKTASCDVTVVDFVEQPGIISGTGDDAVFKINGEYVRLTGIFFNGKALDLEWVDGGSRILLKKDGTAIGEVVSGSVKITLYASFLDNLPDGAYSLTATFADESGLIQDAVIVETGLTVARTSVGVTGVTLSKTTLTLAVGKSETLAATIRPSGSTEKGVTWKSSDTSIATVDANGKVTGVKAGTAAITVTTDDGGYTATCTVTVTAADTSDLPKTGDDGNILPWALLGAVSMLAGLGLIGRKQRRTREKS